MMSINLKLLLLENRSSRMKSGLVQGAELDSLRWSEKFVDSLRDSFSSSDELLLFSSIKSYNSLFIFFTYLY
jgi:hypothetical protein